MGENGGKDAGGHALLQVTDYGKQIAAAQLRLCLSRQRRRLRSHPAFVPRQSLLLVEGGGGAFPPDLGESGRSTLKCLPPPPTRPHPAPPYTHTHTDTLKFHPLRCR